MNWQAQRPPRRAVGLTAAATAALAALGLAPAAAMAQGADNTTVANGASVTLLTPFPGTAFTGAKQIEISAFYQDSSASGGITSVEILIDGQSAAVKRLDRPELRGVVSFLIDPTTLDTGTHQITIRVSSLAGEHPSVRTSIRYNGDDTVRVPQAAPLTPALGQSGISVLSPRASDHVSGIVTIKVDAIDPSGKAPYVSVFIDKVFKSLRNHPPYTFDWDTTRTTNGWHTIEVSGFNDDEQIGKSQPIRVYVNNGGGDTTIDRGLSDTPAPQAAKSEAPADARVVSADDARLAKPGADIPSAALPAPALIASASVGEDRLSDDALLAAPFMRKQIIPPHAIPAPSAAAATLARPNAQSPSVSIRTPDVLEKAGDPNAAMTPPSLSAPSISQIKQPAPETLPSSPANLARGGQASAPVSALPSQRIAPATADAVLSADAKASAPSVAAQPAPETLPSSPANLARGEQATAPIAALPPQRIAPATADTMLSADAKASAPSVAAQPAPETLPSSPANLARGDQSSAPVSALPTQRIAPVAADTVLSADAKASVPSVAAQPAPETLPSSPANLARGEQASAPVAALPPQRIAPATVDTALSADATASVPSVTRQHVEAPLPSAPAEMAMATRSDVQLSLPVMQMRSAPADVPIAGDANAQPPATPAKAAPAPAREIVPSSPAALATTPAGAPASSPSIGAQILASAGYMPGTVEPNMVLKAPFMVKKAQIAAPTDAPPANVVLAHPASKAPAIATVKAPAPRKIASATIMAAPAPSIPAPKVDLSSVSHSAMAVPRPASGLFSASVRHKLAGQFEVVMNNEPVALDRPIQDHGNVLCAPIRQIIESQGGVLFWSPKSKTVRAFTSSRDVQLQIGSKTAKINDQDQKLTTAPYLVSGRTMIPVGFLPLALDVVVSYDAATGHLDINSNN